MDIKLLLIAVGVCVLAQFQLAEAGNKEHVHIKVHVPEIIKKHTHHRTIIKHHYKVKPKPKPKPPRKHHHDHHYQDYENHHHHHDQRDYERRDPSIRHGTLHGKYQRPYWMDHLVPSASHHKETRHKPREEPASTSTDTTVVDSPEILTRWKQNFKLLNRKPAKKPTKKKLTRTTTSTPPPCLEHIEYSPDNGDEELNPVHTIQSYNFNEQYYGDIDGDLHEHHIYKQPLVHQEHQDHHKYSTLFSYPEVPKLHNPFDAPTIKDTLNKPQYEALHSTHSQFSPPHVLKITEDDIRKRPERTSSKKNPESSAYGGSDSYLSWDTFDWTTPKPDLNVEHHYLRPTTSAIRTMAEVVSQEEFMPVKQQSYEHHHQNYGQTAPSGVEADGDEDTAAAEHTDFGLPMTPLTDDLYQSFTKRKNIRSGKHPLVITMDR